MQRLRLVMWCIAAGVVINLLVAWAAAVWSVPGLGSMAPVSAGSTPDVPPPALMWRTPVPGDWPSAPTTVQAARGPGLAAQYGFAGQRSANVVRAGWPLLSHRSSTLRVAEGSLWTELTGLWRSGPLLGDKTMALVASSSSVRRGMPIQSKRTAGMARRLPLEPIWLGFAGNTLFYAAALFVPPVFSRWVRSGLRRRRGCCTACGYSLDGNTSGVCPECGTPRTRSNRVHE